LLKSVTSFNAVTSGPERQQSSLFTRGTNSNHTLVTINGSSIVDHSTTNGLTDIGMINTSFIDNIHLIKGPMSTVHGPNAIGGVIDLQTSKNFNSSFKTTLGKNNTKKIDIDYVFGDFKEFNLGFYIEKSDGISIYPKGSEKDGYNVVNQNFAYSSFFNNTEYDILLANTETKTDLDASGADDLDYTGDVEFTFLQYKSLTNMKFGEVKVTFDYNKWDRKYINGNEIDTYDSLTNHGNFVFLYDIGNIENATSLDYFNYSSKFNNMGSYTSSVDKDASQIGLIHNIDYELTNNLLFSGGIRYDYNSQHGSQETYRLGIGKYFEKTKYYFSLSTGYKNPTMYEMFGADSYGYIGNPDLNPETSINKEIGFNLSNNPINFEISLFDTSIENMITYSNSTYSNDTDGSSIMKGADIEANFSFKNLQLNNSLSHVHAVDSSDTWLKRRPHDIFYTSVKYWKDSFWVQPSLLYYGDYSDTHSSDYTTIQVKNRTITDLSMGYNNFIFNIKNVFNDNFERPHGYNQGGRYLELRYEIKF